MIKRSLGLLILAASCQQSSPHWTASYVEGSSNLTYHDVDPNYGIALEMVVGSEETSFYLDVHSHPIPPYADNPKEAIVTLSTGDEKYVVMAMRREGGQRLIVPKEAHAFILSTLRQGLPLTIQLEGYTTTIDSKNFKAIKELKELAHEPHPQGS